MTMPNFKPLMGLALSLALSAIAPAAGYAQDATELSAEEIEALFKQQKTRGLVLVPQGAANTTASTTGTATAVAPSATTVTPTAPAATGGAVAPVTATAGATAPATTISPATTTAAAGTAPTIAATPPKPTYVAVEKQDQVNLQISFDFDSAALRADQKPKLATLCQVMQNIDVAVFQIVGHTDSSGSAAYNEKLSLLRAQEVKRHLVSDCGIAPERLQAIGVGESSPFNTANPRADENRRVEFQALG